MAWKPLLKVTFCVIIAWAIPSDFLASGENVMYIEYEGPVSKFLYDIRGNSSVLIMISLKWRASHVGHVTRFLSSNTLI